MRVKGTRHLLNVNAGESDMLLLAGFLRITRQLSSECVVEAPARLFAQVASNERLEVLIIELHDYAIDEVVVSMNG